MLAGWSHPAGAIGVALLVLAWLERHVALLVFALGYLAVVLVPINFGWGTPGSQSAFVPMLVISGGVLLLGAAGFALAPTAAADADDRHRPTAESPHPVNGLDDVVHQRVRLGILTIAHEARRVEFGFLRTQLELTAGNLSQHLGVLETAGLVEVEKGYAGKRGRTWITLTAAGNTALAEEIGRLKLLIARVETTTGRPRPGPMTTAGP